MSDAAHETYTRINFKIIRSGVESLTPGERRLYAVAELLRVTNQGGLYEYFFSDAGGMVAEALQGLDEAGAAETAEILRSAVALFPSAQVPPNREERQCALENFSAEVRWEYLSELTAQFYRVSENAPELIIKLIDERTNQATGSEPTVD